MAAPIPLRGDFDASELRVLARKSKDGPQARRLLALAAIYEGATRSEAAKIGGVGLQIIRDWVLRFNARGPGGLLDGKAPGQPSKLNDAQRQAVAEASPCGSRARLFLVDGTAMRSQTHRADRVTLVATALPEGKLRLTCAGWEDARAILPHRWPLLLKSAELWTSMVRLLSVADSKAACRPSIGYPRLSPPCRGRKPMTFLSVGTEQGLRGHRFLRGVWSQNRFSVENPRLGSRNRQRSEGGPLDRR